MSEGPGLPRRSVALPASTHARPPGPRLWRIPQRAAARRQRKDKPISTSTEKKTFVIEHDHETVAEVDARMKAVDKAKEISSDAKGPVIVERSDGAVRMEFRHGEIYRYRFDTNRRAA